MLCSGYFTFTTGNLEKSRRDPFLPGKRTPACETGRRVISDWCFEIRANVQDVWTEWLRSAGMRRDYMDSYSTWFLLSWPGNSIHLWLLASFLYPLSLAIT